MTFIIFKERLAPTAFLGKFNSIFSLAETPTSKLASLLSSTPNDAFCVLLNSSVALSLSSLSVRDTP